MKVVDEPFPERISTGSVVTIGKFDGLHIGHRQVIAAAVQRARDLDVDAVVVTFHRNPHEVVRPYAAPRRIFSLETRVEHLAATGADIAVVLRFDEARAAESAADFVRELLVGRLGARAVYVGEDFRFGRRGQGDIALLRELGRQHGFDVVAVPLIGIGDETKVSSTRIRALIEAGEVRQAARLLGTAPTVVGRVVHGDARGRTLGFPTANLELGEFDLVPADGVYAGWALVDGDRHAAAISVSDNPTFADVADRRVEAYLLDVELDLYGHRLTVEFVERIRGIERFDTVEGLVAQMHRDVARTRAILGRPEPR